MQSETTQTLQLSAIAEGELTPDDVIDNVDSLMSQARIESRANWFASQREANRQSFMEAGNLDTIVEDLAFGRLIDLVPERDRAGLTRRLSGKLKK